MRNILLIVLAGIVCFSCRPKDNGRSYELVWEDDFNGEQGQLPDANKWTFDIGTDWGNQQLEFDTDSSKNVSLDGNGNLLITAYKESYAGTAYTSGRIKTEGLFEQKYGRIEARMKMPSGAGLWPAFWMLGNDIRTVDWPQCGEIDIMEYRGQEPQEIHGSLHGPGYSGGNPVTSSFSLNNARFDNNFYEFSVEWGEDFLEFFVDKNLYQSISMEDLPGNWVYDHPFFIILNLAVGGNYVGPPNAQTTFPQSLAIDYVRVYKEI